MSACLESTRKWLRLAFACLAVVAGGLPAQAQAQPEAAVAAAVHRAARARPAAMRASPPSRPWLRSAPRSLTAGVLQPAVKVEAQRAQGPPRTLFLVDQALLR